MIKGELIGCIILNAWGEKGIQIIWCKGCEIKKVGECWVNGVIKDGDEIGGEKFAIIKPRKEGLSLPENFFDDDAVWSDEGERDEKT